MKRTLLNVLLILSLSLSLTTAALAQQPGNRPDRPLPPSIANLKLSTPLTSTGVTQLTKLKGGLFTAHGPQQVVVTLGENSVAQVAAQGSDPDSQRAQLGKVKTQQEDVVRQAESLDPNARILGSTQKALNSVLLEMDAANLPSLANNPSVVSIDPIIDYHIVLTDTVPFVGATAVHNLGFTGKGVRVAVLDSGIDYTHSELGGSGNPADYEAIDPTTIMTGTFPTAKVVGGYDFVGEQWTGDIFSPPLMPDPNPIDKGTGAGHGTHVADIIAGKLGVAPDASLYAVKVCSSVSTSCSGVALLEGIDFALDPGGTGDVSDHVDLINMSLGSDYGTAFDDPLSQAVNAATRLGVLTVAAAGNGQDKPFIAGTPAAALTALAVAQTQVPSAKLDLMEIVSPAGIGGTHPAVHQSWSPEPAQAIQGPVQYGDGAGGDLNGCDPFAAGSLTGKIVLVDRGSCNFTLKAKNISEGGAIAGLIGLIAAGDPFDGGDGGDRPITVPVYMISQADSTLLKSQLTAGVTIQIDPAKALNLIEQATSTSSRGPSMSNLLKPEIAAPGGSVSAVAGSGTGMAAFGGTSGAAPMVTGAAALLKQAYPDRSPLEIKALLVDNGETNIQNKPPELGGDLAPVTRIGGGELRVDRALNSPAAAWDSVTQSPTLSFGFRDVTQQTINLRRSVTVHNYSKDPITYNISPTFRFANDQDNGAVQLSAVPETLSVQPGQESQFWVVLTIDGTKLRPWGLNSGSLGASGDTLTLYEYDGYIDLVNAAGGDNTPLHLPWQILPRQAAKVEADTTSATISGKAGGFPAAFVKLNNDGVGTARIDSYSLIGTSPNLPRPVKGAGEPIIDLKYVGVATYPVPAGYCSNNDSFAMSFAVNTWERQTIADAPGVFEFDLDTDNSGIPEYAVFNFDLGFPGIGDGRNVTWVANLNTGEASAMFFTDHGTNSANTVLTFCGDQIGMTAADFGKQIQMSVSAVDIYYTGNVTDSIQGITIAPLGERYLGIVNDIPSGGKEKLVIIDLGAQGTNPSESGVLLMLDAPRSDGTRGGAPPNREAMAITVNQP